jgi:hypothetical protein
MRDSTFERDCPVQDLVSLHYVRVVEARRDLGLAERHRAKGLLPGKIGTKNLEDDQLVEITGAARDRKVHVGHAALSELNEDAVLRKAALPFRLARDRSHHFEFHPPLRRQNAVRIWR